MVNITPTLFVGLGGTGLEILLGVRRLFHERYGTHEVPCINYLWIDTQAKQRTSNYYPPDHIAQKIAFQEGEVLFAEVPKSAVKEYFEHPETYPHLFNWMARSSYENGPDAITEGAGQFRPFGRLAFFHNYKKIRTALVDKMDRVAAQATIQETNEGKLPFRVRPEDRKLKVQVVGSVAGGTGSGMIVDVPFLVRDVANRASGQLGMVMGYLILPDVYVHGREVGELSETERRRMMANGYACLSELEYFSRLGSGASRQIRRFEDLGPKKAVFRTQWALDEPEKEFYEFPFSSAYVIGNSNSRGIDLNSVRDVVEMTAEMMYLDFDEGGFTALRTQREKNIEMTYSSTYPLQYTGDDGRIFYSNPFSCRFSAFGLSKIYVDRMRLRHAGAYQLAAMIAQDLIDGRHTKAPGLPAWFDRKVSEKEIPFDDLARTLGDRIYDQVEGGLALPGSAEYKELISTLKASLSGQRDYKKVRSTLQGFMSKLSDEFLTGLRAEMPRLVREHGAKTVQVEIDRLVTALDGWSKKAEKVPAAAEGPALKYAGRLAEAESLPGFPPFLKKKALHVEKARLNEEVRRLVRAAVQEMLGKSAARHLYAPLVDGLRNLHADLGKVHARLADLVSRADETNRVFGLERHLQELLDVRPSPRNQLLLRDLDLAEAAKKALGADAKSRLAELKGRFEAALAELDRNVSTAWLYGTTDGHHVHFADLKTAVVRFCHEALVDFLKDRHSVLELFRTGGSQEIKKEVVERIAACRPFVRFDEAFVTNWLEDRIAPLRYAALSSQGADGKDRDVRRWIEESNENFQIVEHDSDAILFGYIVNGLPLCAIDQVRRFGDEFNRLVSSGSFRAADFHLDKNVSRFPKITREDRETVLQEIEGLKSVLSGIILGLVQYNASGATFVFEFQDQGVIDVQKRVDCGANLALAHRRFRQDRTMTAALDAARNRWIQERYHAPDGLEDLVRYRIVLSYYERYVFRRLVQDAGDEESRAIETTEHLVVLALIGEVDRVIASHPTYDKAKVDKLVGDLKHWLESFSEFVGPEGSKLLIYRRGLGEKQAVDTLRYHSMEVVTRSALDRARLETMNPIDPNPKPPESWVRQWGAQGILSPVPSSSPDGSGNANPFARTEPPRPAMAGPPRAEEPKAEAPDPFAGM